MDLITQESDGMTGHRRELRPLDVAVASAAVALSFALAALDVYFGLQFNGSVGYPTLLLACWWIRSRRFLWTLAILVIGLTIGCAFLEKSDFRSAIHRSMAVGSILVTAGVFHGLLQVQRRQELTSRRLEQSRNDLAQTNRDLAERETKIAHQNEELRSQTEELERQGEELRVANDELARRERTLEALLRLSRALTADMSRSDAMDRICQALSEMVNGPGLGVGVKLKDGETLRLICHYGFGPAGPVNDELPYENAFGRLVLERNHTGYLEDIALRPDLIMPQPKDGEQFRSILAAPLRVNGKPVGTLEVYARDRRAWTAEQVNMVESLAAQTSISLEAAELFEKIERERTRFETILRTLPIGVSVLDFTKRTVQHNPAATIMMGLPPSAPIDQHAASIGYRVFIDGREAGPESFPLWRASQGQSIRGQEVDALFPGGKWLTLLVSAEPLYSRDQKIEGAIGAFVDATPMKQLQQQLDMRRRSAEEASLRKSRFLAQVSHDIRNPTNAIGMLAELLYRTSSDPALAGEVPEIAADLRRNTISLVDLVSDVLDLTRYDSGRIELEETEFSLNEMLHDECRGYREMASEKGLEFRMELPRRNVVVRTDRVKLSRVLGNLLSNAMKFTSDGFVEVTVGLGTSGTSDGHDARDNVWIRVSDSGPGIEPQFHQKIFDEFFQLRQDRTAIGARQGAGLGLAICKRLIEAMGGSISVQSQVGGGSSFMVTLPASSVVPV